jgi:hypothetical protein
MGFLSKRWILNRQNEMPDSRCLLSNHRQLPKLNVAGSIPVSRSSFPFTLLTYHLFLVKAVIDSINRPGYLYSRYIVAAIQRAAFQ